MINEKNKLNKEKMDMNNKNSSEESLSLTVMTALAKLSAKSRPSLTLPLHTAKKTAPSNEDGSSSVVKNIQILKQMRGKGTKVYSFYAMGFDGKI